MREAFENPGNALMDHFFPGSKPVSVPLPSTMRQHVMEQEADTILKVQTQKGDEFIFHLEFQQKNNTSMARRMASYDFMLHLKYNMNVIGMVVYIGESPLKMNDTVSFNNNLYRCEVIDIRSIDAELFLRSDKPNETVLAILGSYLEGESVIIIQKILARLQELLPQSPAELLDRLSDLKVMAGLRGENIHKQILQEEKTMIIYYDAEKLESRSKISKGITREEAATRLSVAENLLANGVDLLLVCKCTGVPEPILRKKIKP